MALVEAGRRPPFPAVLHVHAALMGAWLPLLLTQTTLMATGRRALHMQLGVAAAVLAPAIVVTGLVLVPTMYHAAGLPPHAANPATRRRTLCRPDGISDQHRAATRFARALLFPIVRRHRPARAPQRDAGMHKRMMILASVLPLGRGDLAHYLAAHYGDRRAG